MLDEACISFSGKNSHPDCILVVSFLALSLGDPSVTIEDVTPPVLPSGSLFPSEVDTTL